MSSQEKIGPDHPLYPVQHLVRELSEKINAPFALVIDKEPEVYITIAKPKCGCAHHEIEFVARIAEAVNNFSAKHVLMLAPRILEEMISAARAEKADADLTEGQAKVSAKDSHLASFLSKPAVDGGNDGK